MFQSLVGDPDDPELAILGIASRANVLRHGEPMHIHHHDQALINAHYIVSTGEDASQRSDDGQSETARP